MSPAMAMGDAMQALDVLHFRGKQEEAIQAVLSGADVLYVFPTGGGKSLVYQVAALCSEGVTMIVSPLVGLLNEQVEKMATVGVSVIAACGGTLDCFNGTEGVKMVYTTPEQLQQESKLCKYVEEKQLQVARVVVDEAHVIRDWEEFR
jgi:ATP-dependent DNA helicase RecQ